MFMFLFCSLFILFYTPALADDGTKGQDNDQSAATDALDEIDSLAPDEEKLPKNSVLIYEFEATDGSAYELSDKLPGLLLDYMKSNPDINAMAIEEMNDISKQTAVEYATGCPSGEYSGCAYVLANSTGVPYAITGSVIDLEEGAQVTVVILDISTGEAALNITLDLSEGAEDVFAETVSRSVISVIKGDISSQDEVREFEEINEIDEEEKDQLDKYTKSSGSPDAVEERDVVEPQQPPPRDAAQRGVEQAARPRDTVEHAQPPARPARAPHRGVEPPQQPARRRPRREPWCQARERAARRNSAPAGGAHHRPVPRVRRSIL